MNPLLNIAIKAARSAGKIITRYMDRLDTIQITEKKENDVVSEVDLLSEQEIIYHIHKAYPDHAILAEESGRINDHEYCWVIDPLDGTTNFVHGFPQFAVSIALKKKEDLLVGVIYDPVRQELYTATKGGGAHLDNRRMRVSQHSKLKGALIGTGFPFRDPKALEHYIAAFTKIFPETGGIRRAGAAALDLAYVAAGRLDGFWESGLKEWDMAAGILMIKEAGGMVCDYNGNNQYIEEQKIIAANPKIFPNLVNLITSSL